jgi:putative ABC transport system permease protein
VLSPQYQFMVLPAQFSERRLYQALAIPGVESFAALRLGIAPFRNPTTGINRNVYVLGVSGRDNVFTNPAWEAQRHLLKAPDEVLFDSRSRPEFGAVGALFQAGVTRFEIADRRVTIKGLFEMGASFSADGTVITTDEGFARLFPQRRARLIDLGLIHLRPDADAARATSCAVLVATHDPRLFDIADRVLRLADGSLSEA